MKLQTFVPLEKAQQPIGYDSHILTLGSCFAEHMGNKLEYFKFQAVQNPFGILFHPLAIENLITRAILEEPYAKADVFFLNERWHCFDGHSILSDASQEILLERLNIGLEQIREQIKMASHMVITLGTAWVYRNKVSNKVVANCHKVPQKEFIKELLSVDEVASSLERMIGLLRSNNTGVQLIFTVSPVRHLKDGFVENQRSKAHLISAIHLVSGKGFVSYFPSYEIMMDELRDYRFYGLDMVHPNELAITYIWEKFKESWIQEAAYPIMEKVEEIQRGLQHRPFDPNSAQHLTFLRSLEQKMNALKQSYPFMDFGG
ncbi:GSCFA domain-containing protein [Sediminicola sp. 1XM1-17]|uniref:GSCFA domain-containing protein n=1 Tax=Sediminicola sp. 1XM1-17 TaxID=3127702 RepID=UPI003076F8C3